MNAREAIKTQLASTQHLLGWFVSDLSDADLLVRPAPGANHIAWQLGHVTASETRLGAQVPGVRYPELPAGFAEQHGQGAAGKDSDFATKQVYLDLFNKVRAATIEAVDRLTDADLDRPTTGPMAQLAPNLCALLTLTANHSLMHAGQFSVVRRKLGKPVLF
jgi:hypothetical protein